MRRGSTHATVTHDAGHVRRRAAAGGAVLALAVGALAGCTGGDPAPDWTPTTATPIAHPTPTPSADPATIKPERPAAMDTFESAGAEAVAVYYMQLYPYVFATGDLTEWKTLSHPECIFCSDVARQVQEQHAADERSTGGLVSVTSVEATEVQPGTWWAVSMDARQSTMTDLDESGKTVGESPEAAYHLDFAVIHENGAWLGTLPVARREHLIAMKLLAAEPSRPQDEMDLTALLHGLPAPALAPNRTS